MGSVDHEKIGEPPKQISHVAVKAKPECCSEQNRNREKRLVERASVHDFALKTTIIEG